MNNLIVYFHRRSSDHSIFYVGYGAPGREQFTRRRNLAWQTEAKKGFYPDVRHAGVTRDQACRFEKRYIKFFGRISVDAGGILVNIRKGGEGTAGFKQKDSTKKKISDTLRKVLVNIDRKGAKNPSFGRKKSEATKLKMSLNSGARSASERERRRKLLQNPAHPLRVMVATAHPLKGKPRSEETKRKISEKNKGRLAHNRKRTGVFTSKGSLLIFGSLSETASYFSVTPPTLCEALRRSCEYRGAIIWNSVSGGVRDLLRIKTNHEIWWPCPVCGEYFDARAGVCDCGYCVQ